jgi:hypothetical protein
LKQSFKSGKSTTPIIILVVLSLCAIVPLVNAFEIPKFCNNLPSGTQMDGESFRERQSVTDGFRLALAGIGFLTDAPGSLEMTDEILENVKNDENFADLIETGFVLKLEKGDERRYYEIFPGGTGYQEIVPSLSSQVTSDDSILTDRVPAFCNNIPEGSMLFSGVLQAKNQNISTKSQMIAQKAQTTDLISFGKRNDQCVAPISLQKNEAVGFALQHGINPPGYCPYEGSSTKWNSNTALVANISSRYE